MISILLLFLALQYGRGEYLRYRAAALGPLKPVPNTSVELEQFEVTNARYALCVQAGVCSPPPPGLSTYYDDGAEDFPITGINVLDAAVFCTWIGRELPSYPAWLQAATRGGVSTWPWGNDEPDALRANFSYHAEEEPVSRVGPAVRADGRNEEGIYDLAGNVAEWTTSAPLGVVEQSQPILAPNQWDSDPATLPNYLVKAGYSHGHGPLEPTVGYSTLAHLPDQYTGCRCASP